MREKYVSLRSDRQQEVDFAAWFVPAVTFTGSERLEAIWHVLREKHRSTVFLVLPQRPVLVVLSQS